MDETSQPLLSVIIPTKNEERHLPACLESAAQQDCTQPWEPDRGRSVVHSGLRRDRPALWARLICEPRPGKGLALVRAARRLPAKSCVSQKLTVACPQVGCGRSPGSLRNIPRR